MNLPPHEWDTFQNRARIHLVFEAWSIAHEEGHWVRATRLHTRLKRLTDEAKARRGTAITELSILAGVIGYERV